MHPAAQRLRDVRSLDDVLIYLEDELDWPIGSGEMDDVTFSWEPEELGLAPDRVPQLVSIKQLRPLEINQPWGVFFLEFSGPRLPLTALRRLLDRVAESQGGGRSRGPERRRWAIEDLLFIVVTADGSTVELHFLTFVKGAEGRTEIRSLPWRPSQSPEGHLRRLADELLPRLAWPDDIDDVSSWRRSWAQAFQLRHGELIATVNRLVERMADTARHLRDAITAALNRENGYGPFTSLQEEVKGQLVADVTSVQFADMCAQTLVYGALTGRVTDPEAFGASPTLATIPLANPFLTEFFEAVHDEVVHLEGDDLGMEQLVADLRASKIEAILDNFGSTVRGGDPVIHLYEEFLKRYDPDMRIQAGAFYTPQPAVQHMVAMVDAVLRERLGLKQGLADPATWGDVSGRLGFDLPPVIDPESRFISVLDPATGTGTFLVETIKRARASFIADGRSTRDWPEFAHRQVVPNLYGLELMLAPYAVAHLKTALELNLEGVPEGHLNIFLTDTLARGTGQQLTAESGALSIEGERANAVKENLRATVCIGNPPYDRVARDAGGGWITAEFQGRSPFDDILDVAREHTIFSHHASLYNKFVYFWRWALWKVFEDRPGLPGVISLITPSSWLTGPGFVGLRQLVRQLADEVWVIDLAGDNRGTRRDENIFAIETPVAIVTIYRASGTSDVPAAVRYRRIEGTADQKLHALSNNILDLEGDDWQASLNGWLDPLVPPTGAASWGEHPLLTDLFPWQQPGCKFGRTWPIAPDAASLNRRWARLVATADLDDRATSFVTARTGRNIRTRVGGRPTIAEEPVGATAPPVKRYGYRSFDRQWALADARLASLERPSLWASLSPSQMFMTTMPTNPLGVGLAASVTVDCPDLHYFCGRGGKDIIPLYRDAAGTPNVDPEVLDLLGVRHESPSPAVEDLFAYCYAILAGCDYTDRFRDELATPGPRVPLTDDGDVFSMVAGFGRHLLWLHTFGERFGEEFLDRSIIHPNIVVTRPITALPQTARDRSYDRDERALTVGPGRIEGVSEEVWEFSVSGMAVVRKWLEYRTATPAGRAARSSSPLDAIRPTAWPEEWTTELVELLSVLQHTVDLRPLGVELLDRVLAGPLVAATDLPVVPDELRKPPKIRPA